MSFVITVCGTQHTACVVEGSIFMCSERNEPEMVSFILWRREGRNSEHSFWSVNHNVLIVWFQRDCSSW
jgi:hypothetical protein